MREDYLEAMEKMFPKGFVIATPDRHGGLGIQLHNPLDNPDLDKLMDDFNEMVQRNTDEEDDDNAYGS